MPVIDDIKENQEKIKDKGFKYKFKYYFGYYSIPALVVILVCVFLFSIIKTVVTAKDTEFEAVFMNALATPDSNEFANELGIDLDEYEVTFDSSFMMDVNDEYSETTYTTVQKLMAVVAAESVDVMLGDKATSEYYFNSEMLADLREYFDEDTLNALGDKVIWHTPVDAETGEETGEAFPIAIEVADAPKLTENGCFATESVYFTVFVNTKHADYVPEFYNYLYEE